MTRNLFSPEFVQESYTITTWETQNWDTVIIKVFARDNDTKVSFEQLHSTINGLISILNCLQVVILYMYTYPKLKFLISLLQLFALKDTIYFPVLFYRHLTMKLPMKLLAIPLLRLTSG